MTACDGYLPVPTIRRDRNVLPAMVNGSETMVTNYSSLESNRQQVTVPFSVLATPDEVDDLDLVVRLERRVP